MNKRDAQATRLMLLAKKRNLTHRRNAALADERDLRETREPDWEDTAANVTAAGVLDELSETELRQLHLVVSALSRLDMGSYGRCAVCGGPIDERRLELIPETDRCQRCMPSH